MLTKKQDRSLRKELEDFTKAMSDRNLSVEDFAERLKQHVERYFNNK